MEFDGGGDYTGGGGRNAEIGRYDPVPTGSGNQGKEEVDENISVLTDIFGNMQCCSEVKVMLVV